MQRAYLIFDIGTGNSRAAVVSAKGEILSLVRENTQVLPDQQAEKTDPRVRRAERLDTAQWKEAVMRLAKGACEAAPGAEIVAVTASSIREGIILLDRDGCAIEGFPNSDRRGEPWMDTLDWKRIWELTDLNPTPILSAVKMLGVKHLDTDLLERTACYTSISDWIGTLFTGQIVWERAQAIQSGLYDPVRKCWSEELCSIFGLSMEQLPPLADAGSVLGKVDPALCRELGLSDDCVFITGTADTQAALAETGAGVGDTVVVSGTTSPCLRLLPSFALYPNTWVSPTAGADMFMLEVNTMSSGINLQRYKDCFLPDLSYEELNEDALTRGLPVQGLPPVYAMFLRGTHLDEDNLTGGFILGNPLSTALRRPDFYHSLCLGIGMSIATCIARLDALTGTQKPEDKGLVYGCGGGFSSPVVLKTVADLTGREVILSEHFRQPTIYGCLALCQRALQDGETTRGILSVTAPESAPALQAYYEKWLECRETLRPLKL